MRPALRAAWLAILLALAGCASPGADDEPHAEAPSSRGLVAAIHPLAAEAGARVLREGGNAIDAAAAVQLALNVVNPPQSGIGGGAFLLVRFPNGTTVFLDGRETAPASATPGMFLLPGGAPQPFEVASTQGYAVGVPGTVRLFERALAAWGTRSLAEVAAPAIALAEGGFPVDRHLSAMIEAARPRLESWPWTAKVLLVGSVCPPEATPPEAAARAGCAGGRAPREGETLVQEDLAATLRLLGERGADAFYGGEVAQAIVDAVALRGGRMTLDDLAAYDVVEREPLRVAYKGREVVTAPPPSSGGVAMMQILGMLAGDDLAAMGAGSAEALHLFVEASHLAFADRAAYLGDPAFADVPARGLLHPDYLAARRALVDPDRAATSAEPGDPWPYEGRAGGRPERGGGAGVEVHTTHFVVIGRDGTIVSCTSTIENLFGTGMVVPGRGFLLNNELTDFDFAPGGPNEVQPGKRPRSSMAPTIVLEDGGPVLVAGAAGGATILSTVAQILLGVLDHGMGVQEAIEAPRVFSSAWPRVRVEPGVGTDARLGLAARGHVLEDAAWIGQAQGAQRVDGAWVGGAEVRGADGAVVHV